MRRLNAHFADPEHGWMLMTVSSDEQVVQIDASDIGYSLRELTDALIGLYPPVLEQKYVVTWPCEPAEVEMRFLGQGNQITLQIVRFPDHKRGDGLGQTILQATGDYKDLCLPFWRALRHLQARFDEKEWSRRWTTPFPSEELARLTDRLRK